MRKKKKKARFPGLRGRRGALAIGSAAAGVAMAATVGRMVWRSLAGGASASGVRDQAALTAKSVMNAAQAHLIDVVEHADDPGAAVITAAARDGVREAAAAGADITAAALGVARGARQVYRKAGLTASDAVDAAREGAIEVAAAIGPAAEQRVRDTLAGA